MSCPSLFNAISEPAMILDLENRIIEVNEKTIAAESLNHNICDTFVEPTEQKKFIKSIKKKGVIRDFTAQLKRKDGSLWWGSSNNHCYKDQDGRVVGIEGIVRDITQQKLTEIALQEMNEKLDFLASHDPMTGIYNRRKFFKLASSKFIEDSTDLYAAMMDIDKFKKINDTYGHPIGDLGIKAVTGTISGHLEKESVFGRLGGEEFAIICRYPVQKDAVKHFDLIREKVKQLKIRTERGDLIRCTISIGLVKMDETTRNLDDLLHRADELSSTLIRIDPPLLT